MYIIRYGNGSEILFLFANFTNSLCLADTITKCDLRPLRQSCLEINSVTNKHQRNNSFNTVINTSISKNLLHSSFYLR